MEEKEILSAKQFVDAVRKECGIPVALKDVCIGRLEFMDEKNRKDDGYVCFFHQSAGMVWYLKAFKGSTERKVYSVDDKKVVVKQKFRRGDTFATAYQNTHWRVVPEEDGFHLMTNDDYVERKRKAAK